MFRYKPGRVIAELSYFIACISEELKLETGELLFLIQPAKLQETAVVCIFLSVIRLIKEIYNGMKARGFWLLWFSVYLCIMLLRSLSTSTT